MSNDEIQRLEQTLVSERVVYCDPTRTIIGLLSTEIPMEVRNVTEVGGKPVAKLRAGHTQILDLPLDRVPLDRFYTLKAIA